MDLLAEPVDHLADLEEEGQLAGLHVPVASSSSSSSRNPPSKPSKQGGLAGPLSAPVDHLAEMERKERAARGSIRSWMPKWSRKGRSAGPPSAGEDAAAEPQMGADEGADEGTGEQTGSFVRRQKRLLVPQALRTIEDEKLAANKKKKELSESDLLVVIKRFLRYAGFLVIFTVVAFSTRSSSDYWANEAMKQLFVEGCVARRERGTLPATPAPPPSASTRSRPAPTPHCTC